MPGEAREPTKPATAAALAGTVVVELGSRIGVGVCGSLLAQLGATVVAVEPPASAPAAGKWRHRAQCMAGKLSFLPDPASASDRDLVRDLIARSDAIVVSSDIDGRGDDLLPAGIEGSKVVCA